MAQAARTMNSSSILPRGAGALSVLALHNERPVELPACATGPGSAATDPTAQKAPTFRCPLEKLLAAHPPTVARPRPRAPARAPASPRARARAPRPGVTRLRPVSRPNAQASCDFDQHCGAPPPPSCAAPPPPPAAGAQSRRWPTSFEAVLFGTDPDADAGLGLGSQRSALVSAEALAAALLAATAASGAVGCLALRLTRTLL